ncbi:UNVERIFIED_CONTAM: hypothetical protein PYX00_003264 [Menopon gallinae]|uniref:Calcineurin-like phosphoesterase domain-containing protein n=1 Tax=Menopon gallinae TaxID=328185 RepID=A0AAW2I1P5_9NEOP
MVCSWPKLDQNKADTGIPLTNTTSELNAMFIADIHLLGPYRSHWFDKMRREWQMHRAFQTAMTLYDPDVVFILGDLFDEGQNCNDKQFNDYIKRLESLFAVPKSKRIYVVPGNHDLGFHYRLRFDLFLKFHSVYKIPAVRLRSIKGNYFVLINSMAMDGDGCYLCEMGAAQLHYVAKRLNCLKTGKGCEGVKNLRGTYHRPIVLQHFPMYRESDAMCTDEDAAPAEIKNVTFRPKWDCLSRDASEKILDLLNPRLIFTGHTHHGCTVRHREDIVEHTLPSFNWRNKNNPTFILGVFTPNNHALAKCDIPSESTVIYIYVSMILASALLIVITASRKDSNMTVRAPLKSESS